MREQHKRKYRLNLLVDEVHVEKHWEQGSANEADTRQEIRLEKENGILETHDREAECDKKTQEDITTK